MSTRNISRTPWYGVIAALSILSLSGAAHAQQFHHGPPSAHQHYDGRFAHNHYYYDRGYVVHNAPLHGYRIDRGPNHFFYDRGQWYRGYGSRFIVVGAPLGAIVPVLPPFFTTVWFGGLPYYYANDTYYTWDASHQGYEVVAPPSGVDQAGSTQPPASDSIFIYPKNGQSSEQQERDRFECYRSAVEQTGYDPTQSVGGVPREANIAKRADYFRAQAACLDARGYSVK